MNDISEEGIVETLPIMVKNILSIEKGTIKFERDFGSNLSKFLFEPNNIITQNKIEDEVFKSLTENLPDYIKIKSINVLFDDLLNKYLIDIYIYDIKNESLKYISHELK